MRLQNNMNVIRHDDPREQIVTAPNPFAVKERLHKGSGNIRIFQPPRAIACAIQLSIVHLQESPPRIGILNEKCWRRLREGFRQPPRDEHDGFLRDPMWKPSVPEHNSPGTGGKTAGATNKVRHRSQSSLKMRMADA
jgi:hypothetical protein